MNSVTDEGSTKSPALPRQVYSWLFLELCTYLVELDKCIAVFPGIVRRLRRSMKTVHLFLRLVGQGWLQSLPYAKLD